MNDIRSLLLIIDYLMHLRSQTITDTTFGEIFEPAEDIDDGVLNILEDDFQKYDAGEAFQTLNIDNQISEPEVDGSAIRIRRIRIGRPRLRMRRVGIAPRLAARRRGALFGFRRFRRFIVRRYGLSGVSGISSFSVNPYNYCRFYPYTLTRFCQFYFPRVVIAATKSFGVVSMKNF
ncbi:hypothetical protein G9A89_001558 [Geosiphon pyriformis]|nr:hypothetical protein G9A89_001558 [Geosiphon pyriformis]